jgi:hypothetical protein
MRRVGRGVWRRGGGIDIIAHRSPQGDNHRTSSFAALCSQDGMDCTTFTNLAKSFHKRLGSNHFMGISEEAMETSEDPGDPNPFGQPPWIPTLLARSWVPTQSSSGDLWDPTPGLALLRSAAANGPHTSWCLHPTPTSRSNAIPTHTQLFQNGGRISPWRPTTTHLIRIAPPATCARTIPCVLPRMHCLPCTTSHALSRPHLAHISPLTCTRAYYLACTTFQCFLAYYFACTTFHAVPPMHYLAHISLISRLQMCACTISSLSSTSS